MKIALVYDVIYPYVKGGAEKRFYEIGKRLPYETHWFGMKFWKGKDVITKDGMILHGVCKPMDLYTGKEGQRSIKQAISFAIKLFIPLMKADFDVLDCSNFPYFPLFTCKLVCMLKRKKMVATWHEVWGKEYWLKYLGWKGYFGYLVEYLSAKLPDEIVVVSEHTKENLRNQLRSNAKIQLVPNGIDQDEIDHIVPSKQKSDVIYAGRLLPHKNIDLLIKSIKIVNEIRPVKCLIVGEGSEEEYLKNLVKNLNLRKNIKFIPFINDVRGLYSLLKASKVFVLPSEREGFGMVILEANACGIPVITTNSRNNAAKELISNGENGMVSKMDENSLSDSIVNLIEIKYDQNSINTDSLKTYYWSKIVAKMEGVYS